MKDEKKRGEEKRKDLRYGPESLLSGSYGLVRFLKLPKHRSWGNRCYGPEHLCEKCEKEKAK